MTVVWTVVTTDGRIAAFEADDVAVIDGALMCCTVVAPPPARLRVVAVWAARSWALAYPADAPVTFSEPAAPAEPKPPRILPAIDTPDSIADRPW